MKKTFSKLIATSLTAMMVTMSMPIVSDTPTVSAETEFNYAEALQKSLYFYECQQAGPLPEWNRVEWRADSTMDDYIQGGWYDAGDHVKFNLPMAYSASMLAWGLYQYGDGVEGIGQYETYQNNLEFVLDYLVDCDEGDYAVYQVGNGQQDHTWWGPVELLVYGMTEDGSYVRPYYTTEDGGYSAVLGEMSAALASGAAALEGKSDKTDKYLETAKNFFEMADSQKSDTGYNGSDASGFYRSSSFYDDLFYSANWLYIATGDEYYLNKATSYISNLGTELGTNELKYSWSHCWDDTMQGGMLLYAQSTGNQTYIDHVKKHLNYWCDSVQELDGGLRWLTTWGCLRYAETAGFISAVACDTILENDSNKSKYQEFYEEQINYVLGSNPDNRSYVVGYDETSPINVHHRTAHGSYKNDMEYPETNRHVLYGALVGGPTQNGEYEDSRGNFINNEVATDYNAGFTALLCKMVDAYGGETDSSFPEPENLSVQDEFYVEATMKQSSSSGVSLSLKFTNRSCTPARIEDNMSYRYYIDVSEIVEGGFKPQDIVIHVDRDQATMYDGVTPAQVSELTQYEDNIWYIEVTYPDGRAAMPVSEGRNQCELMLALVFPNYQTGWDATNDYSNQDLLGSEDGVISNKIPLYQNGVFISGIEPNGDTPQVTETTTTITETTPQETDETTMTETSEDVNTTSPSETSSTTDDTSNTSDSSTFPQETLLGNVNCDGNVKSNDLLMLKKYLLGLTELDTQALKNADINQDGQVKSNDLLMLKKFLLGLIELN